MTVDARARANVGAYPVCTAHGRPNGLYRLISSFQKILIQ